jgi:hypothetical protein
MELWSPGRDLAVDEAMSRFQGRSYDTLVLPGKPIEEGYKIWVLSQKGYFLAWCFHRKGSINTKSTRGKLGPYQVTQPKELGDNNSSAVAAHLMAQLPTSGNVVYLDNLFTNTRLLKYGRTKGWGATGTCTAKSGTLKLFGQKKKKDATKDEIPWGTLWTEPTEDNLVNLMAWKDNALVLFMSTVDDGSGGVERLRKRPSETSSAANTSRVPFGDYARALLKIPEFDDNYNYNMGAVDQGNSLKVSNTCARKCRKGGHQSLINWLLDTALVNSYLLSFHSSVGPKEKFTDQEKFRTAIIAGCFALGQNCRSKRKSVAIASIEPDLHSPLDSHSIVRRAYKQECVVCKREGIPKEKRQRVLRELSTNIRSNSVAKGCRKTTNFGCNICDIPLCKDSTCFNRFHYKE